MGNNCSHQSGQFIIYTDKPVYYPGETVHASIYAVVGYNNGIRDAIVNIYGKERVEWRDFDNSHISGSHSYSNNTPPHDQFNTPPHNQFNSPKHEHDHHNKHIDNHPISTYHNIPKFGERTIFCNTYPLGFFNSGLNGQYQIPVSIYLPPTLPSTFEYVDNLSNASINYTIEVIINRFDGSRDVLSKQIVIRQAPSFFNYPLTQETTGEVKVWCSSKGSSALKVSNQKNSFNWNESMNLLVSIDNSKCAVNVSELSVKLHQKLTLRDHKGQEKYLNRVAHFQDFHISCPAFNQITKEIQFPITNTGNPCSSHYHKSKNYNSYDSNDMLASLQMTCRGSLITCEYYVTIDLDWDGVQCCSGVNTLTYPIVIYAQPYTVSYDQYKPNNWNPQTLNSVDFNTGAMVVSNDIMSSAMVNSGINMNMGTGMNMNFNVNSGGNLSPPMNNNSGNFNVNFSTNNQGVYN